MVSLKDEALAYEPPMTKNIAELDKFPIDIEVISETHTDKQGEEFNLLVATIEGQKYRIAGAILSGIKALLKRMPSLKYVSVIRSGEGLATRYQVIPFVENR